MLIKVLRIFIHLFKAVQIHCALSDHKHTCRGNTGSNKGQDLIFLGFYFGSTKTVTKKMIKKQNTT